LPEKLKEMPKIIENIIKNVRISYTFHLIAVKIELL